MRDSNFRTISSNRPIIPISQTIYDRKAIDIDSAIPLINSLNNLTYLTSHSGKIRETIASDGSIERLMSILQNCHLSLFDVLFNDSPSVGTQDKHVRVKNICKEKKLALCSWKWTLAFQCLVLTGTRGSEDIRRKVVSSGVISLLATVLDNFLIYHKKFDFINDKKVSFASENINFDNLLSRETFMYLRSNLNESYEEYVSYLLGYDFESYNDIENLYVMNYLNKSDDYNMTMASDFGDIWKADLMFTNYNNNNTHNNDDCMHNNSGKRDVDNMASNIHDRENNTNISIVENAEILNESSSEIVDDNKVFTSNEEEGNNSNNIATSSNNIHNSQNIISDDCFSIDLDHAPLIAAPRSFYFGKIIPKQDDVIWSLQLLAFISKYSYMKKKLQKCEIINTLSFRSIVDRVNKRLNSLQKKDFNVEIASSAGSTVNVDIGGLMNTAENYIKKDGDVIMGDNNNEIKNTIDPFLLELIKVQQDCSEKDAENKNDFLNISNMNLDSNPRIELYKAVKNKFNENWSYDRMNKELDDQIWNSIINKKSVNIFPLVEKFTVTELNSHDMIYWSSVIMRNSCKKDETKNLRQCANFDCGKWESYPKEFAKCRRCKRTKYCSRECQLKGWTYHRYWCHEATVNNAGNASKMAVLTVTHNDTNEIDTANIGTQNNSDSREGTMDFTPADTDN